MLIYSVYCITLSLVNFYCMLCFCILKVWMSVLAVLTIEFARTIALALTISEFSKKFTDRFLLPIVKKATPAEYQVCI